ncbi:alpha/beta family hydrolase [Geochorda subterranea]|uniref:Alpha/beta family hydrolase n=1 Tax=Geochorda subterranea TaxID=3109564 RepID=A0ABZ1BLF6_9FIRM|nr:alpha/beta family hydrolase [Limnochorda sp. LNt]WRP13662.1 alpha/beta family hydrolase [Limnochorda sp. LNt]
MSTRLPARLAPAEWETGETFERFVEEAPPAAARHLRRRYDATTPSEQQRARWRAFAEAGGRVYALAEDWCGDCLATVPVLARLADEGGVPLRLWRRDAWPDLRDRHLTGGRPKIPLAVAVRPGLDGSWEECGRFVERPAMCNAAMRAAGPEQARAELQRLYASGAYRPAAVQELTAMLDDDPEPVAVPGSSGTLLQVYVHLPVEVPPTGLAVVAHGANHDASHPLSRHLCQRLAQRGVGAVRFDFGYRVRGKTYSPDLADETADMLAVAQATAARLGLPLERVVLAGKSLGAAVSVALAERHPVAAVVAFGYPLHRPGETPHDPPDRFARLGAPMMWLAGTHDDLAERRHVERYASAAGPSVTLRWLEGADHSLATHLHEALDAAVEWILARLAS